jgi:capsular polysaccharide biosynthesis protein
MSRAFRRLSRLGEDRRLVSPASVRTFDYLERYPGRWHVVHPAKSLEWPAPRRFGSRTIQFDLPTASAEFGVLEIDEGRVFGAHGWVIGVGGAVLSDLSWYAGPSNRIRIPSRLPAPSRLSGTCLSLVSDWSCRNYAHFLLDGLGRLALFLDAGLTLSEIDHIYCPRPPSPAAGQLLDRLIPREKRVLANSETLVQADRLFVPSLPATSLTYPAWLPSFLRAIESPVARTRRLYVTRRGHSRGVASEENMRPLLLERGFEMYDPSEHIDQPADFSEAAVVVGAHGAGLANLAFCSPGTKVLELLPTDNVYPFYYSLSVAGGLRYAYLVGTSRGARLAGAFGPSPYDFDIDPEELVSALVELTET